MVTAEFNQAFGSLLAAFNRREELRLRRASLGERSAAAHDLHRARMDAHRALTIAPPR